jgi:hypothetical protein
VTVSFDQLPIGSVSLTRIIRDPEHVSPRIGLSGRWVDCERVRGFKQLLVEDLRALPEPICVESQGALILADGHHRLAALEELARELPGDRRFEFVSVRIANTPPGQTPAAYAYEIAVECSAKGPLPLTRAEKQAAIERLIVEHPGWSDREIGRMVGVDHKTVGAARRRGISPPGTGAAMRDRHSAGVAATSPARVARIAGQIVRYGHELGAEDSEVDYDEIVAELTNRSRSLHPTTASMWAEWWESIWRNVRAELEAGA